MESAETIKRRRPRRKIDPDLRRRFALENRVQVPISDEMREKLDARVQYPDTLAAFVRRLIERELAATTETSAA